MSIFLVDREKCARDRFCAQVCPRGIIEMKTREDFPKPAKNADELCINCGHCVSVCPHGAMSLNTMGPEDCPPIQKELILTPEHAEHFLRYRRSIRRYKDTPLDRDTISKLIRMAAYAPSGHNMQPVKWLVVEKREEVKDLAGIVVQWMRQMIHDKPEIAGPMHFDRVIGAWMLGKDAVLRSAPHLIVAHGIKELPAAHVASIIALTYLELAATSLGVGACWAGYFMACAANHPPMAEALALPQDQQVYGAMMVGRPKYPYQRLPLRNEPSIAWR
ncbi:nitroreductase family protein [Thermodesulfobacteriota bacterium]